MSLSGSIVMLLESLLTGVQPSTVMGDSVQVWLTVILGTTLSSATFSSVPFQRYLTVQLA